ncbi:hypothetical protein D3C72_1110540 [compost metagenome]
MAEQHRARGELLAQAHAHFAQGVRVAVAQAGIDVVQAGFGTLGIEQAALDAAHVVHQQVQRAEQALPLRALLVAQVGQRIGKIAPGLLVALAVDERAAQADRFAQPCTGLALQVEQALAAVQHVAVEERIDQRAVRIVRGAGALMEILCHVVQAQVQAGVDAGPAGAAKARQDRRLRLVQRADHAAVLFGQVELAALQVRLAHGFEQGGLELQVTAQFYVQAGHALAHRPVGEQRGPQNRQQPVPDRTRQQVADRVQRTVQVMGAMLLQADHGVDGQGDGRLGDGRVTLAECAEQCQAERGQRKGRDEDPRPGEQPDHRGRRQAEAQQRQQHGLGPAPPVVIGLGNGAGDDAQEHAGQRGQRIQVPAHGQGRCQGNEHPQAIAGLLVGPQAAEAGFACGHAGSAKRSASIIAGRA